MTAKIFAHRGASKFAPENTMASFQLAYDLNAEGIETDVHLTKDHVPVLIHDEHVRRTTNGSGFIKDLTWMQLKHLDAGSWFSKKFAGSQVVSLERFLQWIKPKSLCLNIELKNNKIDYKHLEVLVYEQVKHYQLLDRTVFSTFNPKSIQRMENFQDAEVAFLTSKRNNDLVAYARSFGAQALHIKYRLLGPRLINQCRRENIPIRVYTVNKRMQMLRCFQYKCDGIFTDIPDRGIKYRKLYERFNHDLGGYI